MKVFDTTLTGHSFSLHDNKNKPQRIPLFHKATVVSVYDGDTITVNIDLGLQIWAYKEKLRLYRINAPEVRGSQRPEGLKSRDFLRSLLPEGTEILISSCKDKKGKYGRYLAEIWTENEDGTIANINDLLVDEGFAEYKEY